MKIVRCRVIGPYSAWLGLPPLSLICDRSRKLAKPSIRQCITMRASLNTQSNGPASVHGEAHTCEWQACLGSARPEFEPCVAYIRAGRVPP